MDADDDEVHGFAKDSKRKEKRDSDLWYERYPRRFKEATSRMPFELRGAYSLLIDLYFEHGKPLPDDDKWIAFGLYIDVRKWRNIRAQLFAAKKLFLGKDGFIHNELADELLAVRKARIAKDRRQTPGSTPPSTGGSLGGDFSKKRNEINEGERHINNHNHKRHKDRSESEKNMAAPVIDLDDVRLTLSPNARAIIEAFNGHSPDEYLDRAKKEAMKGTKIRDADIYCVWSAGREHGYSKRACRALLDGNPKAIAALATQGQKASAADQERLRRMSAPSSARANLAKSLTK